MIFTTRDNTGNHSCKRPHSAFTLTEVIVVLSISGLIAAGTLSAFLFFTKSGINISHYFDLDRQARRALEQFATDIRMARSIDWTATTRNTRFTVTIPTDDTTGTYQVVYEIHGPTPANTRLANTFTRMVSQTSNPSIMPLTDTDADGTPDPEILITGIIPTESRFTYYLLTTPTDPDAAATLAPTVKADQDPMFTKQLNLRLIAQRKTRLVSRATNTVISARYILRNNVLVN